MATGLGEPVYGLSEEEVSSCPERCVGKGRGHSAVCVSPASSGSRNPGDPERSRAVGDLVLPPHWGGALLGPGLSGWAEAACAAAPRVPFLSKPRLSGLLGNFPSWACPCSLESVTCVTFGSLQGSLRGAGDLGIVEETGGVSPWDFSC